MIVKLLTEHNLEFLSLKGGCIGSSESTLVKILNGWKSHAATQTFFCFLLSSGRVLMVMCTVCYLYTEQHSYVS